MLYNPCPNCGANLDPGEVCDCEKKKGNSEKADIEKMVNKPRKER